MEITVALGGGGIKCFAPIGVIQALEKSGFKIKAIAGTSIGGLIGGLIGSGLTPDILEAHLSEMNQVSFWKRLPNDGPSMLHLAGVTQGLADALGDLQFDELKYPVVMTAVDIQTCKLLALQTGSVIEAILASIAFPDLFPSRQFKGRTLVDGTGLDPVPVGLTIRWTPGTPVAGLVLAPQSNDWVKKLTPRLLNSLPFLTKYISRLRFLQAKKACRLDNRIRTQLRKIVNPERTHYGS